MEGFLHLLEAGVLSRKVADGIVMHGGFFLGSQRVHSRFINSAMMQALSGAGGQYNFVAMAHELPDARFQADLLAQAQDAGKISVDFVPPKHWQHNTPETIHGFVAQEGISELFPAFPFGHDFTEQELILAKALKSLAADTSTWAGKAATLLSALSARLEQRLLRRALRKTHG